MNGRVMLRSAGRRRRLSLPRVSRSCERLCASLKMGLENYVVGAAVTNNSMAVAYRDPRPPQKKRKTLPTSDR